MKRPSLPHSLSHSLTHSLTHSLSALLCALQHCMQPSVTVIGGMSVWVRSVVGGWVGVVGSGDSASSQL